MFYGVLGYFGKALIVLGAFYFGRHMSKTYSNKLQNYAVVLGVVAILSLVLWSSYGTHTEDGDPVYGGGETVTDFEPTDKERNEYGWQTFFVLTIPALLGVYKGQKKPNENLNVS